MTAPIWLASPPELHSALLSSGPGPGPLLASAGEWSSLSVTYAETAEELSALLADVEMGAWDGPSAAAYVTAHAPYLAWLMQASADCAAMAAEQEATAAAYTTALAAMPTLAELAANHATNAVLTATNFFGINTIPIALNEADYVRMWIQAATVMGSYQAVSTAAVAAAPQTPPAPPIMKANGAQAAQWFPSPPDWQKLILEFLNYIGYTAFFNNYIQPIINWIASNAFLQALFAFDPYLLILADPLTYLSPLNIAFALGYPMDIGTYIALLSETFGYIAADLAAAFASGNPVTIGFTILAVTVEAIGTIITDTIALMKTLLEQALVVMLPALLPLVASAAPLAAGAVLAPLGVKGLAALAVAPPPPPPVATPTLAALAPSPPPSTPSPTPAPAEATVAAPAPSAPPPPTTAPPSVSGAGVGAHLDAFGYLVGDLNAAAKRKTGAGARKKAPEPDSTELPAAAEAHPQPQPRRQRRRRTQLDELGRGYEYADPAPEQVSVTASDKSAGFAGIAHKRGARPAAGLMTLTGDALDIAARVPMTPSTWEAAPTP